MAITRVFSVTYRSVTEDGRVWCESRSLDEVIEMSKDKKVTYHRLVEILTEGNWEEMSKKDLKKAMAKLEANT